MARYEIVPHRTRVLIDQGTSVHTVHGSTHRVRGWIDATSDSGYLDLAGPLAAHLEVEVTRFSSGNSIYDREMHRVIDSRRYPLIEGDFESIEPLGGSGLYRVSGSIRFHGQRRPVRGEVSISEPSAGSVLIEGEQTFDIREWGVDPPRISLLGGALRAEPVVRVRIHLGAERKEAQT